MTNKEIHQGFLWMAAHGEVRSAFNKFVAPNFIHHNLYFKGDRESLLQAMEQAHTQMPNKQFTVKHTYEDRNFVITHSELTRSAADAEKIAVVHISKIENGKITEMWDLGTMIPKDSPNENGAF